MSEFAGLHIGVDQDEVLAFWNNTLRRKAIELYPHIPFAWLDPDKNTNWDLIHGLDTEGVEAVRTLMDLPGFYAELEPIPGAKEALLEMQAAGIEVSIITAPTVSNPTCASDKLDWLEKHIGPGWGEKGIITRDKTKIVADILIDDRPEVTGYYRPTVDGPQGQNWDQIIFDQPYNQHATGLVRMKDWSEWRAAVGEVLARQPMAAMYN